MAMRRRIPMKGDSPQPSPPPVVEPEEPEPQPMTEVSSSEVDWDTYDWGLYEKTMCAFLVVHDSVEGLVDMWRSNANMLDFAKKVAPQNWERIRDAFAKRKLAITGD